MVYAPRADRIDSPARDTCAVHVWAENPRWDGRLRQPCGWLKSEFPGPEDTRLRPVKTPSMTRKDGYF